MNYRLLGIAGVATAVAGTFLPFASVANPVTKEVIFSIQYASGDGMIVIVLMAIAAIFFLFNKFLIAAVPAVLSGVTVAYSLINVADKGNGLIQMGPGVFVTVIGVVIAIIASLNRFIPSTQK